MPASADAILHQSFILPSGLPPAADELLQRLLFMATDFVSSLARNGTHQRHQGYSQHPGHRQPSGKSLRTPKLSVLGFASLLFGISSTLMLFGLLAFLLGFMLMPLILPASILVCISALLAALKDGWRPSSASSMSMWGSKILLKEPRF